jgi:hypothetical protein
MEKARKSCLSRSGKRNLKRSSIMAIINKRRFTEYGKCITSTEPQVIALKLVRNIKDMAKLQERKRLAYLKARQWGY